VLDRESVQRAVAGCARVFHAAAVYSVDDRERERIVATAVEGTRNVLQAAARAGADRVVYTSSVATLGSSREPEPRDETAPPPERGSAYVEAKVRAEAVARKLAREVPVVIVNPSVILGPWDFKPTPSTRLVARLLASGGSPVHFRGGVNVVDARDAAAGHLLAEARGRPGERYILGGSNVTFRQLLDEVAAVAGLRRPWLPVGRAALLAAGSLAAAVARVRGREPAASPARLRGLVGRFSWFTTDKAARELGWSARSFDQTIRDTVRWCLEQEQY
jgi:dihydroflavonol-4-reductase